MDKREMNTPTVYHLTCYGMRVLAEGKGLVVSEPGTPHAEFTMSTRDAEFTLLTNEAEATVSPNRADHNNSPWACTTTNKQQKAIWDDFTAEHFTPRFLNGSLPSCFQLPRTPIRLLYPSWA